MMNLCYVQRLKFIKSLSLLCGFDQRDENGDQFISLGAQVGQASVGDNLAVLQKFEPVISFIQFLQRSLHIY